MIINIPTKPFIKNWILSPTSPENQKLATDIINILHAEPSVRFRMLNDNLYTDEISLKLFRWLPKNITSKASLYRAQEFNRRMADIIRRDLRKSLLTYLEFDGSLKRGIEYALTKNNLDETLYNPDAIIKDYQRYRKKYGGIFIYSKKAQ